MTAEETKLCQIRIARALAPFFIPGGTGHDSTALDRAVIAVMDAIGSPSPSQPAVSLELCPTCGEDRPFSGTCGTSDSDTRALCKRKCKPPQKSVTLTDDEINQSVYERTKLNPNQAHDVELLAGIRAAIRAIIAASAPAVPMSESLRADMICAVAALCTGASSRTVAATAIEWTERYYGIATTAAPSQPVTLTDGLIEKGAMTGMVDAQIDDIVAALREKEGK